MSNLDKRAIRYVRDKAAVEDFFGSHKRIADALIWAITSSQDVRLIGVLGSWVVERVQ